MLEFTGNSGGGACLMRRSVLLNIFIRSLTIQASFNFWRMQNLGFAFAMLPLIRSREGDQRWIAAPLARHLQMFNTHPYLAAPVIGAVAKLEEEGKGEEANHLKKALMGPYAAIGDSFFWGALRTFSAAGAVILAFQGHLAAPLVYLLLYNPAHLWIRGKGFWEGYRRGKEGIDFIKGQDLPGVGGRIRVLSLIMVGILAATAADMAWRSLTFQAEIPVKAAVLSFIILCLLGVRRGISPVRILYGTALLCMALSI